LAAAGLLIGLIAGLILMRFVASLLFGISAHDPATFGVVALVLGIVAFLACYVPARRASRVSPLVALRYE
jgi:putative ABC transport system permease protein